MSDTEEPTASNNRRQASTKDDIGEIPIEASPGEAFVIFVDMNTLSNKLKLLNYEDEYLTKWKMKPISKLVYFT